MSKENTILKKSWVTITYGGEYVARICTHMPVAEIRTEFYPVFVKLLILIGAPVEVSAKSWGNATAHAIEEEVNAALEANHASSGDSTQ